MKRKYYLTGKKLAFHPYQIISNSGRAFLLKPCSAFFCTCTLSVQLEQSRKNIFGNRKRIFWWCCKKVWNSFALEEQGGTYASSQLRRSAVVFLIYWFLHISDVSYFFIKQIGLQISTWNHFFVTSLNDYSGSIVAERGNLDIASSRIAYKYIA